MASRRFGGVRFIAYSNDHPPRHVHGFTGETEVIVDLLLDGKVALAKRNDAIRPANARRSDVKKILRLPAGTLRSLQSYGSQSMKRKLGRHTIVTTDAEMDRAIARAQRLRNEPLVTEVEYRPRAGLDLLVLKLNDGRRHLIPREDLEGLQAATKEQIANIEIVGGGTGLHWPDLDVDLYVPALLRGVYGNRQWMAKIGRRGGLARSPAKKKAARANGLKGGRPKWDATAAGD